jgi:hypothetical protein
LDFFEAMAKVFALVSSSKLCELGSYKVLVVIAIFPLADTQGIQYCVADNRNPVSSRA